MRKCIWWLGLSMALAMGVASAGDGRKTGSLPLEKVLTTTVDAWIVIDEQGSPTDFGVDTKVPEALAANLDRAARKWKFRPVQVDGAARKVRTPVRISLNGRQQGKDYLINIENVVFPANESAGASARPAGVLLKARSLPPPSYPQEMQRRGINARVLVALHLDAEGNVIDAMAVQSTLLHVSQAQPDPTTRRMLVAFERSAVAGARRWKIDVDARGRVPSALELTAYVPVSYTMMGQVAAVNGLWRHETRNELKGIGWLPKQEETQRIGVSDLLDGEMYPVASEFRFVDDVRGQAL